MRSIIAAFSALFVPCLLFGCTRPINRAAERRIRDALPAYIGPAREWRAHVENAPERTIRGRLARVTIEGDEVIVRGIVKLTRLWIEMQDADVDTRRTRLRSVGRTSFHATVREAELNEYLRVADAPDDALTFRNVRLGSNRIAIDAGYLLLGQEIGFKAEVEPRLASPTRLEFDPERFALLGVRIPLPRSALQWLAARLTEGFDFSTLPFPVSIHEVQVEKGRLHLKGTADVIESLNQRIAHITRK